MSLIVLNVAYPLAPVGPDAVGGAEQVVAQLDAALVRAGETSVVVGCAGSVTQGSLASVPRPPGNFDAAACAWMHQQYRVLIRRILEEWPIDLVHLHGIDCFEYLPGGDVPVLITLHLPPQWYPRQLFDLRRPRLFLNCVSASQRRSCPPCARLLPEIENGVPNRFFAAAGHKRRFALALGRICPEKGFHLALDAAEKAAVPLLLGGQVFPYDGHRRYFDREIAPRLGRCRKFIGAVGGRLKDRLLASARCLLAPSLVPETSSLVAMEALACGTPVIGFPSGALADIVEHGKTGFLVHTAHEMAEAIHAADHIDPQTCRAAARERFSLERATGRYLALYRQLARESRVPPEPSPGEAVCAAA